MIFLTIKRNYLEILQWVPRIHTDLKSTAGVVSAAPGETLVFALDAHVRKTRKKCFWEN